MAGEATPGDHALEEILGAPDDDAIITVLAGLSEAETRLVTARVTAALDASLADPTLAGVIVHLSRILSHAHKVRTAGPDRARRDWHVAVGQLDTDVRVLVTEIPRLRQHVVDGDDREALSAVIDREEELLALTAVDYLIPTLRVKVVDDLSKDLRLRFTQSFDGADLEILDDLGWQLATRLAVEPAAASWWAPLALAGLELSEWYLMLYDSSGDEGLLTTPSAVSGAVIEEAPPDWWGLTAAWGTHGRALSLTARARGSVTLLDVAVSELDTAIDADPAAAARLTLSVHRADALSARFDLTRNLDDLRLAVDDYQVAIAADGPMGPAARYGLANALHRRYTTTGTREDLDAADRAYREALDVTPVGDPNRAIAEAGLAVIEVTRFHRDGRPERLDTAIGRLRDADRAYPDGSPAHRVLRFNLGTALRNRYERTRDPADADAAESAFRDSLPGSGQLELPQRLAAYALAVHARLTREADPDLGEVATLESVLVRAIEDASPVGVGSALWRALGLLKLWRHQHDHDLVALDAAIDALETISTVPGAERPFNLNAYADAVRARWLVRPNEADQLAAITAYRTCGEESVNAFPQTALEASRSWGIWAASRGAWTEAREALDVAVRAMDLLYAEQLTPQAEQRWLRDAQGVYSDLAYAAARCGDPVAAAVALETGRGRLLSELLGRERSLLATLEHDAPDLHSRLVDVLLDLRAQRVADLQPDAVFDRAGAEARRADLDHLLAQVRAMDGYGGFLEGVRPRDVLAAGQYGPLLYITPSTHGGLVVAVGDTATATLLPGLTTDTVTAWAGQYRSAYETWVADPGNGTAARAFDAMLTRLGEWLWGELGGPIRDQATEGRAVLALIGPLQLFPIHAASTADPTSPTGRACLSDHVVLTQVVSAAHLVAAQTHGRADPSTVAVVTAPSRPDVSPLPYAGVETAAVASYFPQTRSAATATDLATVLPDADVVHVACHATADTGQPLRSRILLGGGNDMSLAAWFGMRVDARLAVLSACETAVPGVDLLDECLSLSTALAGAGCAGVIASLWPIADVETAMVISDFYRRWMAEKTEPAQALRDAQRWLRDSTNAERAATFRELRERGSLPGSVADAFEARSRARNPVAREAASPIMWAPLVYSGR
jgi:hypothetical protein